MDRAVDDPGGSFAEALLQSVLRADEATGGWRIADDRLLLWRIRPFMPHLL